LLTIPSLERRSSLGLRHVPVQDARLETTRWAQAGRRLDRAEERNVAEAHPDVVAELNGVYYAWLEDQLGPRPDPLRFAAEENSTTKRVQARYEAHLAAEDRQEDPMTPQDRADIDNQPAEESA